MNFSHLFKQPDIDQGVATYLCTPSAVLLDVRTPAEYRDGHIPKSINVPLQNIDTIISVISEKDTPLFVYCYSGGRSQQATNALRRMGYTNVTNIGGIMTYSGALDQL